MGLRRGLRGRQLHMRKPQYFNPFESLVFEHFQPTSATSTSDTNTLLALWPGRARLYTSLSPLPVKYL